jgi:hypothetical protein
MDEYMMAVSDGKGSGRHLVNQVTDVRHSYAAQGNHRRYLSSSSKGNSARMNNGVDKVGIGDGYGEDNISGSEGF